jgi:hypothetical protein
MYTKTGENTPHEGLALKYPDLLVESDFLNLRASLSNRQLGVQIAQRIPNQEVPSHLSRVMFEPRRRIKCAFPPSLGPAKVYSLTAGAFVLS